MVSESLLGTLPPDFSEMTLGDACALGGGEVQTGPFGSQLHASDYVASGIPVIMPQDIGDNRLLDSAIARITEADADRLARHRLKVGDIVYSRRGDVKRRALVREENEGWICGTGCLRVRFGNGPVVPLWASYYLGHPEVQEWVLRHAVGATMPNLNTSILSQLPFVVPPKPVQSSVASILGTLDDKIELNRQMNQTLEQIAAALFRSWFVDFDPVRARAEGRQPEGMDAETAALFPDRLVGSEIGEIPEGWAVASLDSIARFLNGLALQKYPPNGDDSLPVIKIAQLRKGNTEGADRASAQLDPNYVVCDGDVLFSWSGTLEVEIWSGGRGALNQHLFKVTSDDYPKWFYYMWTRHHLAWFRELARDKATTMGHIQRRHLAEAHVLIPPKRLLEHMDKVFNPILKATINNSLQSRTLASLRDSLLPRLLSGEISVGSGNEQAALEYQERGQASSAKEPQLFDPGSRGVQSSLGSRTD